MFLETFQAAATGLSYLDWRVLLFVVGAVCLAQVISAFPGLGDAFTLALLLSFTFGMEPITAIAILVGASVVSGTGNTITSCLFGIPGSSTGVAVVFDGYPMAQKGQAGRAIAAGLTASMVGGILGAICMALLLPVVRPLVLALSSPEFFMLVLVALVFMAYVGESDTIRGIVSGGFGLMLAFVGMEPSTAVLRFTFGHLYLWDGLQLVPVLIGLFAIAEMIDLVRKGGSIADTSLGRPKASDMKEGVLDVFRHWRTTGRGSAVGVMVGLIPGLGGAAAQFISYTSAARASKTPELFGKGAVEGVIAADASTNSKDGGALIPTLAFGIPGSASMAILLAAFIGLGIQPGRSMLAENLSITWMIIFLLVFANVVATSLCLGFANLLARLTFVRASLLVPPILSVCLLGAYASNNHVGDIVVAFLFGVVGYFMKRFGFSRATLTIGLVLGGLLETHYLIAMRLFGASFLLRPWTMVIIGLLVLSLVWPLVRKRRAARAAVPGPSAEDAPDRSTPS